MAQSSTAIRSIKRDIPFLWEGKDKRGKPVRGKSLARDEAALRVELRRQGVAPSKIKKQAGASRGGKPNAGDIAVFARQLATMLAAGIPMVQSFDIVGAGHEKPSMQKLILDIKADVEGGTSLHESLAKRPLYFDDLFVNLVEAGEQAGALESLLDKVATYKEKTEALKKKVKKALFYPAAVLVVAVIVTIVLLIFVIPQFEDCCSRTSAPTCLRSRRWSSTCRSSYRARAYSWPWSWARAYSRFSISTSARARCASGSTA